MIFVTAGLLPKSSGRWYIREAGGHVWFVPEFEGEEPYVLYNGALVRVVDAAVDATAPLIMPKVDA